MKPSDALFLAWVALIGPPLAASYISKRADRWLRMHGFPWRSAVASLAMVVILAALVGAGL